MRMPLRLTTCSRRKIEYSMTPDAAQRPGQPCYHDSTVTKGDLFLRRNLTEASHPPAARPSDLPVRAFAVRLTCQGGLVDTDELAERSARSAARRCAPSARSPACSGSRTT